MNKWQDCMEGGVTVNWRAYFPGEMSYSIDNNILVLQDDWWSWPNDTLNFTGTSDNLIGTWTRTKNAGYEIVKAEFTEDTLKFTYDYCITDREVDEAWEWNGWKNRIINCNSFEMYKGTEKIIARAMPSNSGTLSPISVNYIYNGKSCIGNQDYDDIQYQYQKACEAAWGVIQEKGLEENYWGILDNIYRDFLNKDFYDCLKNKDFPLEAFDFDDDYEESGALMKKSVPVSKKRNLFGFPKKQMP
ncbi:MAG: hypothetical protein LBB36_01375 [Fibromonadaceae bacterium]|nr:hypothetical protein [Fibromonadaceae bacterium]